MSASSRRRRGGTILLDEIDETSQALQVQLLRVLQEREVRRVGEVGTRPVDVRVVAATNRDLAAEVAAGRFREDLYYRLRVVEIPIPPLRERGDDVLELARLFLRRAAARIGREVKGFSPEAARLLLGHAWPGNVRELENAIERAVILGQGPQVTADDLPPELSVGRPVSGGTRTLEELEREAIRTALAAHGGHREKTAEQLGIAVATLYRKIGKYGLTS